MSDIAIILTTVACIYFLPLIICRTIIYFYDKMVDELVMKISNGDDESTRDHINFHGIDISNREMSWIPILNIVDMFMMIPGYLRVYKKLKAANNEMIHYSSFEEIKEFCLDKDFIEKIDTLLVMATLSGWKSKIATSMRYRTEKSHGSSRVIFCNLGNEESEFHMAIYIDRNNKFDIIKMRNIKNTDDLDMRTQSWLDIIKILEVRI